MDNITSYCEFGTKLAGISACSNERKLFEKYVDDITCAEKGDLKNLPNRVNSLHKNLQFFTEKNNEKKELVFFLNMSIVVMNQEREITCKYNRKSTDTETIVNYFSCTSLQHKKHIVKGTKHWLFRCTGNWNTFDEALKTNQEIWKKTQYPESWPSKIVKSTFEKLIIETSKFSQKAKNRKQSQEN